VTKSSYNSWNAPKYVCCPLHNLSYKDEHWNVNTFANTPLKNICPWKLWRKTKQLPLQFSPGHWRFSVACCCSTLHQPPAVNRLKNHRFVQEVMQETVVVKCNKLQLHYPSANNCTDSFCFPTVVPKPLWVSREKACPTIHCIMNFGHLTR